MSPFAITLGVRRRSGAKGDVRQAPRSLTPSLSDKILKDQDYTCQCCGFRSRQYQRVLPGYLIPACEAEFVTLCSFCENCFSLERAGLAGSGVLIWLPEMTQARLNHLARAIFVAKSTPNHPAAELATRAQDALMQRRTEAKKRLGSDDPLLLATVMLETMSADDYARRDEKLAGIRLLPLDRLMVRTKDGESNQFDRMVKYWQSAEGPFADWRPERWQELLSQAA